MLTADIIHDKLTQIYDDLAANVTHIHGRQDLHLAIDLGYHSPISFKFDKQLIAKGYPEILIIGDTRTGKTMCANAMLRHYGCGAVAQAEAMTYAGLVGGCQKMFQDKWDITWGKLPQNNRRLVIIDETSGMDEELLGKLSDIRSSGIATLEKILSQKTEARTRIIWLSNPRGRETVAHFSSGVSVIESLCKQPEDIARWDMALVVAKEDIVIDALRELRRKEVPHVYTKQLCRALVLWAWTRDVDEIKIGSATEDACYKFSSLICKKYCSDFTLVTDAEMPVKIMRLAVSLAGRLFATPDGHDLVIEPAHVEYIYRFLQHVYDAPAFGFDTWSQNRMEGQQLQNLDEINRFILRLKRPGCMQFLGRDRIKLRDLEEFLGISTDEARVMLSMLLNNNALYRFYGDFYHKAPAFNKMLRVAVRNNDFEQRALALKPEKDGL